MHLVGFYYKNAVNYCLENRVFGNGVICSLFSVFRLKAYGVHVLQHTYGVYVLQHTYAVHVVHHTYGVHVLQHTYGVNVVHHTDPFTAMKRASIRFSLWRS